MAVVVVPATIGSMKMPTLLVFWIALHAGAIAQAADPPPRPKDAAEAIQEGNVRNWVEYYERTRQAAPKPNAAAGAAPATTPPAASAPAQTPRPER